MNSDRRHFLLLTAIGFLSGDMGFGLQQSEGSSKNTDPSAEHRTSEEWMNAWMNAPRRGGETPLYMGRFKDPMYFITQPVSWAPNPGQSGYAPVTVPVGFVTTPNTSNQKHLVAT